MKFLILISLILISTNLKSQIIWDKLVSTTKNNSIYYTEKFLIKELKNKDLIWIYTINNSTPLQSSPSIICTNKEGVIKWQYDKDIPHRIIPWEIIENEDSNIEINCKYIRNFTLEGIIDPRPFKLKITNNGKLIEENIDTVSAINNTLLEGSFVFTRDNIFNFYVSRKGINKQVLRVRKYNEKCQFISTDSLLELDINSVVQVSKDIIQTHDSSIVINLGSNYIPHVIKLDQNLNKKWIYSFANNDSINFDLIKIVDNVNENTISVYGTYKKIFDNQTKVIDGWFVRKLDENGNLISKFEEDLNNNEYVNDFFVNSDKILLSKIQIKIDSESQTEFSYFTTALYDLNGKILFKSQWGEDYENNNLISSLISSDSSFYTIGKVNNQQLYLAKYKPTLLAIEDNKEKFSNEASIYSTSSLVKLNMKVESLDGSADIKIYDAFGKEVKSSKYHIFMSNNSLEFEWDASSQANGIYVINITQGKDTKSFRVLLDK